MWFKNKLKLNQSSNAIYFYLLIFTYCGSLLEIGDQLKEINNYIIQNSDNLLTIYVSRK